MRGSGGAALRLGGSQLEACGGCVEGDPCAKGQLCVALVVTNELYEQFIKYHDRDEYSPDNDHPVVVDFDEAMDFCAWLSGRSGLDVRLPTEAEWECACRAGSTSEYCFGDDVGRLPEYAWFRSNPSDDQRIGAQPVRTRRANAWGLYDLHGNAFEWCMDEFRRHYRDAPTDGTAAEYDWGGLRVIRGGGWVDPADSCRSAWRGAEANGARAWMGFRPAFSLPASR